MVGAEIAEDRVRTGDGGEFAFGRPAEALDLEHGDHTLIAAGCCVARPLTRIARSRCTFHGGRTAARDG